MKGMKLYISKLKII